jgi:class 3 adenylate cyclase
MATTRIERRLAAIVATDVVGYRRLLERDEAGTFERLERLRQELVEPVLERHGGRFVDLKGDGAVVELEVGTKPLRARWRATAFLVPDDPWAALEPLLPPTPAEPEGGRPRVPDRAARARASCSPHARASGRGHEGRGRPGEPGCSGKTCWRRRRDRRAAGRRVACPAPGGR